MNLIDAVFPCYLKQQAILDEAWEICERRLADLGIPLAELANLFFRNVSGSSGTYRSYFSNPLAPPLLYMPIWLFDSFVDQRILGLDERPALVEILVGTMLGYFCIRTQDDVLDEPEHANHDLLLLGNACCSGMIRAYGHVLGQQGNTFWPVYDRAMVEFSSMTLAERRAVWSDDSYEFERFEQHADKVAFARIPLLVLTCLAGRMHLEEPLRRLIHQLGVAYGITNDVIGWPRDVRNGHRTWLLANAGFSRREWDSLRSQPKGAEFDAAYALLVERLRRELYENRLIRNALARAIQEHRQALETARHLSLRGFGEFTAERIAWLEQLDRQTSLITLQRTLVAKAG